jgi:hypothetical protein
VATDIGLFAVSAGVLRDLTIRSVAVSSSRPEVIAGGLAGDNWGSIIGVTVSGKVVSSGSLGVAGMVAGTNSGHVAEVNVSGKSSGPHAGGLVGENTFGGIVENSASTGTVTGGIAGGAVGINRNTIRLLWASGVVHGGTAGGLVGENEQGTVGRSYASGTVEGHRAGGLIGLQDENALAEQCYAIGAVTSVGRRPETAAGLIGDARGKTLECYATGAISGVHTGGFVADAESDAAFRHDYWDIATTGQSTGTMDGNLRGIDGLTDGQLKATLPDGFNPRVWGQDPNINNGWPYLLANPPQ